MIEKFIAQIEAHELACRIAEAVMQFKRPPGLSAEQALASISETGPQGKMAIEGCYRAALSVGKYLEEAVNNFQRVQ